VVVYRAISLSGFIHEVCSVVVSIVLFVVVLLWVSIRWAPGRRLLSRLAVWLVMSSSGLFRQARAARAGSCDSLDRSIPNYASKR